MPTTKTRTANSLGMFDLLKGIGMLLVVFSHTVELYPLETAGGFSLSGGLLFFYREALMSAFFIASGYGFRQRPLGKCIRQQAKALLLPYLYTALATAALHLGAHYAAYRYWPGAVTETLRVLAGFGLGLPHTAQIFGVTVFSCGPMWYLLTLAVSWVLLDALLNLCPERLQPAAVLLTMTVGWGIGLFAELPFCLVQSLCAVPYLYIGYLAKRRKWLDKPAPRWYWLVFAGAAALIAVGALLRGYTDSMSDAVWTLGPVSILLNCAFGVGSMFLFTGLNRFQGGLARLLRSLGRRSLYIFCFHTIENIALPWYILAAGFVGHPLVGAALHFALRSAFIFIGCCLLELRRYLKRILTRRKRSVKSDREEIRL